MIHQSTQQLIEGLDAQWREYYEERAAILEFDCHLSRLEAEHAAWMETSAAMLKSRVRNMAEHQRSIPKSLTIPRHEPIRDRKLMAAGDMT